MLRTTLTAACLLAASTGCVRDAPPPALPPVPWQGPPVTLQPAAGGDVTAVLTAPTLGYRFELEHTAAATDAPATADLFCRLTAPAADAMVGQALTDHRVVVPQNQLPADTHVVRLWIARWQDGVHYIRAPDPVLAATLRR